MMSSMHMTKKNTEKTNVPRLMGSSVMMVGSLSFLQEIVVVLTGMRMRRHRVIVNLD